MFTHDEDMWLLQYIVDCQKDNKKHLSGNIIFEELARDVRLASSLSVFKLPY